MFIFVVRRSSRVCSPAFCCISSRRGYEIATLIYMQIFFNTKQFIVHVLKY